MQKFRILAGSTSVRLQVFLRDNSVAYDKGKTGLAYNTASLTAYYFRDGATSATAITLVTATLGTWASGGFIVVDGTNMPGLYEIGIPNAAIASGAKWVTIEIKGASGLVEEVIHIELLGNNEYSAAFSTGFNDAIAAAIGAQTLETGVTWLQALRAMAAFAAGDFDETTDTFKAIGNPATTRITVDDRSSGSRENSVSLS
jgi:hypothetical protein